MLLRIYAAPCTVCTRACAFGMEDWLKCGLCGKRSLREGAPNLTHLECCDGNGFLRHEVEKYVECERCKMKMSVECLDRWNAALQRFKEKDLAADEELLDDEGVWATMARSPWTRKRTREDEDFLPSRAGKAAKLKRACVDCEESIGQTRVRAIEAGFKDAKPDLQVHELAPVTAAERCESDGQDGPPLACAFDVVSMFPLVAKEACDEYFKAAHDQLSTTPGACLPATHSPHPPLSRVRIAAPPFPDCSVLVCHSAEPALFHSVPTRRGGCELRARLFQVIGVMFS